MEDRRNEREPQPALSRRGHAPQARRRRAVSARGSRPPKARARRSASIRAHSFRSFLTTLGIVIGVASVIAMVSIIQGLERHDRPAVPGPRQQRRYYCRVHVARELSAGTHRSSHAGRPRLDSLPRRRARIDHADHERAGAGALGLEGHGRASRRLDVRLPGHRPVFRDPRPVHFGQRQRDAPPRRRHRRASSRGSLDAGGSGRRVHSVQRRVAQGHRLAGGEGRDLRPEPGQPSHHPVQHAGELAGQPTSARHVDPLHGARLWQSSTT